MADISLGSLADPVASSLAVGEWTLLWTSANTRSRTSLARKEDTNSQITYEIYQIMKHSLELLSNQNACFTDSDSEALAIFIE